VPVSSCPHGAREFVSAREFVPTRFCTSRVGALQVHGVLAAFIKWGIEWVKVAQVLSYTLNPKP
jgi:hypothetical protein